jgi:response regulator RpfG family c-di-GMP phosphodiesterase
MRRIKRWTDEEDSMVLEVIQRVIREDGSITEAIEAASVECNIEKPNLNGRWNSKLRSKCSADVLEILERRQNARRKRSTIAEEKEKIKKQIRELKEKQKALLVKLKALEEMEIK